MGIQTAAKTFNVSAELAMGTNSRLTTSCAWGISSATWRFFAPTILILGVSSGRWRFTGYESHRQHLSKSSVWHGRRKHPATLHRPEAPSVRLPLRLEVP